MDRKACISMMSGLSNTNDSHQPPTFISYIPNSNGDPAHQISTKVIRKSHKKSRLGCHTCKRRKIKCPENRPNCNNCVKINTQCTYDLVTPANSASNSCDLQNSEEFLSRPLSGSLGSTPGAFNLTDLRLFHHFVTTCFPHLPLGNSKVWTTSIASISHSYDFLAHAVLALSASHLTMTSTFELGEVGLSHRLHAVRGLNEALSHPPKTSADVDAMLATCYALAMQSSYIGESVEDFLTMIRGCQIILDLQWPNQLGTVFENLDQQSQQQLLTSTFTILPEIDQESITAATKSLEALDTICKQPLERKVLQYLLDIVISLAHSSRNGWLPFSTVPYNPPKSFNPTSQSLSSSSTPNLCSALSSLPQATFQLLVSPDDPVMQTLLAHFAALLVLVYPIKSTRWSSENWGTPNRDAAFQLSGLLRNVPRDMQGYLDWPRMVTCS
ncbi:hypothetical protein BKA64DRAFT_674143 [Cadophora sp. MPI-SDFR-AT-0126]|nr:hypothetical protein BKA64DRAFT_674143 [Leotiomycetes sp. MPI-SDFR-AT-0126]